VGTTVVERSEQISEKKVERFYRPELVILRFVAFMAVFVCHGPRFHAGSAAPPWKVQLERWFEIYAHSGALGVCLFFLLSSYLITELLLQEREKTGTVHLKAFYIRRILRIWPLYYLGVAIAIVVGFFVPWRALSTPEVLYLLFFVGWLGGTFHFNVMGPLWSVSVEEMFYAIWPTVARMRGGKSVLIVSLVIVPISLTSAVLSDYWYNPITQFLLFAFGALLALWLRQTSFSVPNFARVPAALIAFASWGIVTSGLIPLPYVPGKIVGELIVGLSCALLFLAIYNCPMEYLPRPLIYLGRISYGLYVFHGLCIAVGWKFINVLPGARHQVFSMFYGYVVPLALTIGVAALSYRFYELPFLRLKRRFTFVRSRD
jgi:peptidoglycan/LPS O-acetylase OafA/YrhL